jgi:subtilase family protein
MDRDDGVHGMTGPEAPRRRKYNCGVRKLPPYQRTIAHSVLPDDEAWAQRNYLDVIGSDSDTAQGLAKHPYGSDVVYCVELTDDEAEQFAAASNLRYLEEVEHHQPLRYVARPVGALPIPTLATLSWLRARYVDLRRWHGRDVPVAVLDQGTTAAVRAKMGFTLLARTITSGVALGPGQELVNPDHHHGCLVAPNAVPAGGQLLDCIISDDSGGSNDAYEAAGIRWAVDNGAKVINLSFGGDPGVPSQTFQDACAYARDNGGVQIVIAAGNENLTDLASPSSASRLFSGVHSSIAFDESTDRRALFSNHVSDASGCSSGVDVTSLDIFGNPVHWNGTSASAPHMAQMMARALSGATYTPAQVGSAFKANTRDTGAGASEQGGGAYDLHRALTALGAVPAAAAGVATPTHLDSRGGAATPAGWTITPASGIAVDDMQIVVLISSVDAGIVVPSGWSVLTDAAYYGGWELSQSIAVGPTRCRVLAASYTAAQPASTLLSFGGGGWFSALGIITVRGAGGLDPEQFAPEARFGTGSSVTAVPTVPATTNDLQLCVFAQRHPNATTGTLSLPSGLTQRGFWRPSSGTTGYTLLAATTTLTSAARTAAYTSTSNDATGTWASMTLTIPGGTVPGSPVVQTELAGPPGGAMPFLPHA